MGIKERTAVKTPWYPATIKPLRQGFYETKHYRYGTKMRHWDGWLWNDGAIYYNHSVQAYSKWRGLCHKNDAHSVRKGP